MEYYTFVGNMTLDEIDDAVLKGLIKYGDFPPNREVEPPPSGGRV
jgi:hypothetical protein